MRSLLLSLAVCAATATAASAVTTARFTGDQTFVDLCSASDAGAGGSGGQACEFALGEIRAGNAGPAGDWEVGVQNPPGAPVDVRQFAWGNGQGYGFTLAYVAAGGLLSMTVDGVTSATSGVDLTDMRSMFVRTRSSDAPEGSASLTGLTLNGFALGDNVPAAGEGIGAAYLQVFDFDFASDWTLAGVTRFAWSGDLPAGSRLGSQIKLTNLAPVPLPAAAWLLLGGVAALGAASRRRRAAA